MLLDVALLNSGALRARAGWRLNNGFIARLNVLHLARRGIALLGAASRQHKNACHSQNTISHQAHVKLRVISYVGNLAFFPFTPKIIIPAPWPVKQ